MSTYTTTDTNVAAFLITKGYRLDKMVRSRTTEIVSFLFDEDGKPADALVQDYLYRRAEAPAREFAETSRELRKQVAQMIEGGIYEK